jgi:hypothetical protein
MMQGFLDELEAIEKEASLLSPAAKFVGSAAGKVGKWISERPKATADWARSLPGKAMHGVRRTPGDLATISRRMVSPKGMKEGWKEHGRMGQAMIVGFPLAFTAPAMYQASKRKPTATGEGGVAELGLGELAGTGAYVASGKLGLLPGLLAYGGAHYLGSKAGRIIDRLRGGASLGTAARAPSPQEAQRMIYDLENQTPEQQQQTINTLRKYYG